ncbi:V-type immunoglobulin domain-containing suppressor of T-cell activation isoform X2 [Hippocampus comes]|uniref:V-type immunoglobulin domain-containing suppressor of T-cell activation isoform X2 n=1 Tax=Hippocampus comes TaxID=109280 RepID=UPI00094E5C68|nr:PREDICTED: V-type immunoglobulin domain-containing suppressor of T-cell activation isoform X2 [Hippocampus comes]
MESGLLGSKTILFWCCCLVMSTSGVTGNTSHSPSSLSISTAHLFWTCPEGATFAPDCAQTGLPLAPSDVLKHAWLFTPHSNKHCTGRLGPRLMTYGHPHGNHSLPPGFKFGYSKNNLWMVLQNVTIADQGRYCCMVLDFQQDHKHASLVQSSHSHVILHVTPRAQELVRMDSEAQGHENPVFRRESPRVKTVAQIMTRQSSGTGRRLLSDPGTPMTPSAHGDVFFPIEDTIPESPDILLL